MGVDWAKLKIKPGDLVCPEHGIITDPLRQVVPACPACLRSLTEAVTVKGTLVHRELAPERCPNGHALRRAGMAIAHRGCLCAAGGGHTVWTCTECRDEQMWPPHTPVDSPPYLGPGHNDAWRSGD